MLTNAQPIPLHIAKRNHELAPGSMETIMEKTQLRCSSKMMLLEAIMKKKKKQKKKTHAWSLCCSTWPSLQQFSSLPFEEMQHGYFLGEGAANQQRDKSYWAVLFLPKNRSRHGDIRAGSTANKRSSCCPAMVSACFAWSCTYHPVRLNPIHIHFELLIQSKL